MGKYGCSSRDPVSALRQLVDRKSDEVRDHDQTADLRREGEAFFVWIV